MSRRILAVASVLLFGSLARAQHFEIEPVVYRGDPKGSKEAGTLKQVAAPSLVAKSGESASLLVGGQILIGQQKVPVGRQVHVTATEIKDGAIRVEAVFELGEVTGRGATPQVTNTKTQTTATIQSGGSLRLELGKDPKDLHWVEITVRKAKR